MAAEEINNQDVREVIEDFPPLIGLRQKTDRNDGSASLVNEEANISKGSKTLESESSQGGDWRALFAAPKAVTPQKNWKFTPPELIKGKRVVAAKSSYSTGVCWCENLVIGFFVGKGLSFSAVKMAFEKHWKLRKEVTIRGFGNGAFIFDFSDEDDRIKVLETGSFYISSKLFTFRPWRPLLEKSVSDIKSIPIWVCIFGIPLHLWDIDGLGIIASFIGKPLLADECTIKKNRLSYARICIEIDIDFDFPKHIPLLLDDEIAFDLPVEYEWRPQKCDSCRVFGHDTKNCSRIVKTRWNPKIKVAISGAEKGVEVEQQIDNGIMNKTTTKELEAGKQMNPHSSSNEFAGGLCSGKALQGPVLEVTEVETGSVTKNKGSLTKNSGEAAQRIQKKGAPRTQPAGTNLVDDVGSNRATGENGGVAAISGGSAVVGPVPSTAGGVAAGKIGAGAVNAGPEKAKTDAAGAAGVAGVSAAGQIGSAAGGFGGVAAGNFGAGACKPGADKATIEGTGVAGAAGKSAAGSAAGRIGAAGVAGAGDLVTGPVKATTGDARVAGAAGSAAARVGSALIDQANAIVSAENNEEWLTVKGRKQLRSSPKRNPFMVLSDFKAESRFPINRKLEDEEFELKFRHLSEEQKKVKREEREMKRLMWNDPPGATTSPVGRTRSQQKKK